MSVKHDFTLNPVTALELLQGPTGRLLILAGEGCYLKVFEAETSRLLCQCQVFDGQTIHGITVRQDVAPEDSLQVIIWGGSFINSLTKIQFEVLISRSISNITELAHKSSDWIMSVAISPYDNDSYVLVTAHNTVLRAFLELESLTPQFEALHSPTRSVLYSAQVIWESPNLVLVAAGTVFGEIITWNCPLSATQSSRVLAIFTGHEGSIFGVDISNIVLDSRGNQTRFLASCSDDRTIRIWDIYGASKAVSQCPKSISLLDIEHSKHGGSENNQQNNDAENIVDSCVAMVMGHASRIWGVKFRMNDVETAKASIIYILSLGEDSTAQQWGLDFRSRVQSTQTFMVPQTLTHLDTFAYHSGKHIWSSVLRHIDESSVLVTGGADGKISSYQLPSFSPSSDSITHEQKRSLSPAPDSTTWDLEDILQTLPESLHSKTPAGAEPIAESPFIASLLPEIGTKPKKVKSKKIQKDSFNRYAFIGKGEIILTTTFGRVLLGDVGNTRDWVEIFLPESGEHDLRQYSVISGVPKLKLALLGGANGSIYLYHKTWPVHKLAQVRGKIADIFQLSDANTGSLEFIVTTLGTGSASFFKIDLTKPETPSISEENTFSLPTKFVVTSIGMIDGNVIMGSRNGSLAVYEASGWEQPIAIWSPGIRSSADAITSITSLLHQAEVDTTYFLTTGRDAVYSVFVIITESNSPRNLYPVHHGTPPLGPNIESAWFDGSDLLLYGFKSKNFVVWNETKQYEIMNVECGGAHRSYAYSPLENGGGVFIYTKGSKLYLHTQNHPSHTIIKPGGHGREIKASAISPDQSLIATGAEDTSIRLWRYRDSTTSSDNKFESLAVIQKHTTGIQTLQFHGSNYLFSSGGNEEFFIWALHSIPGFGIGIVYEAGCPDQSEERDLRIMDFDISDLNHTDRDDTTSEASRLLISLAYSDSTIKVYQYSKMAGFCLLSKGRYTSSCLMQIRHLKALADQLYLLTAATDGRLIVWRTNLSVYTDGETPTVHQLLQLSSHKLHQSTIKCLDLRQISSLDKIIVATGGDDNALGLTTYSSNDLYKLPTSTILGSAHAAALTGLTFVGGSSGDDGRIVSSSNDQRVKEWNIRIDENNRTEIRKSGDHFTSVADVGDITLLRDRDNGGKATEKKVLLVGNGMEVFTVSS